jgi:hypothetical protein
VEIIALVSVPRDLECVVAVRCGDFHIAALYGGEESCAGERIQWTVLVSYWAGKRGRGVLWTQWYYCIMCGRIFCSGSDGYDQCVIPSELENVIASCGSWQARQLPTKVKYFVVAMGLPMLM